MLMVDLNELKPYIVRTYKEDKLVVELSSKEVLFNVDGSLCSNRTDCCEFYNMDKTQHEEINQNYYKMEELVIKALST